MSRSTLGPEDPMLTFRRLARGTSGPWSFWDWLALAAGIAVLAVGAVLLARLATEAVREAPLERVECPGGRPMPGYAWCSGGNRLTLKPQA